MRPSLSPSSEVVAPEPPQTSTSSRLLVRVASLLKEHLGATVVVTAGALLRVAMMVAYPPALWYDGDSRQYVFYAEHWPTMAWRWPYPWFLKAWQWTGTFMTVTFLQHLAILVLAVGLYAFLRRQSVPKWLGAAAIVPLLFDARQLTLEQYLLTETLFISVVAGAVLLVAWSKSPRPWLLAAAGVLAAIGWATRATGVIAIVVTALFLLLRSRGFRQPAVYALGVIALLSAASWHAGGLQRALTMDSSYLYARTVQVADCDRLQIRDELRPLCPPQPLDQRPERPDWYLWDPDSPIRYAQDKPELLGEFARAVITQQPLDYLRKIGMDSSAYFVPTKLGPGQECLTNWWRPHYFPADFSFNGGCVPHMAGGNYHADPQPSNTGEPTWLSTALRAYGLYVVMPPWLLSIAVIVALVGATWPRRGGDSRLLILTFLTIGLGVMLLSVATAMYEPRFGIPALAFIPVAAAIGWHRMNTKSLG